VSTLAELPLDAARIDGAIGQFVLAAAERLATLLASIVRLALKALGPMENASLGSREQSSEVKRNRGTRA
jgi:hypothetical protein